MKSVLFLCTGNYYRSRFAEELFNHLATKAGSEWMATSRGLALERGFGNIGSLSPIAKEALEERGLDAKSDRRMPGQCLVSDLRSADLVVALMESEHRPLVAERFPDWECQVKYWQVGDIGVTSPKVALDAIEQQVVSLLANLLQST